MSADTEQRKLAAIMFTDMGGLKLMPFWDHCAAILLSKNSARKSSREPCAISVSDSYQRANNLDC
jgi:inosine-uridine nucleoside N-ribohydrolase